MFGPPNVRGLVRRAHSLNRPSEQQFGLADKLCENPTNRPNSKSIWEAGSKKGSSASYKATTKPPQGNFAGTKPG